MTKENTGVLLDWDVADGITLCTLTEYRSRLQQEIEDYYEKNEYLHLDDLVGNKVRIDALNLIIKDFGGE